MLYMKIKLFGYSISLNVLVFMGILYLIIVLHAVSGACNMEGMSSSDKQILKDVSDVEDACESTLDKIQLLTTDPEVLAKIKTARSIKTLPPSFFNNQFGMETTTDLNKYNPFGTTAAGTTAAGTTAADTTAEGTTGSWYDKYIPTTGTTATGTTTTGTTAADTTATGTTGSWYDKYIPTTGTTAAGTTAAGTTAAGTTAAGTTAAGTTATGSWYDKYIPTTGTTGTTTTTTPAT